MSTLSVWRFDTPEGADKAAVETLGTLSVQQLVTVHDAATVTWPVGAKKPKTRQWQRPELLFTNLATEQENALREAFAD